jgi:hypothetical protein
LAGLLLPALLLAALAGLLLLLAGLLLLPALLLAALTGLLLLLAGFLLAALLVLLVRIVHERLLLGSPRKQQRRIAPFRSRFAVHVVLHHPPRGHTGKIFRLRAAADERLCVQLLSR